MLIRYFVLILLLVIPVYSITYSDYILNESIDNSIYEESSLDLISLNDFLIAIILLLLFLILLFIYVISLKYLILG